MKKITILALMLLISIQLKSQVKKGCETVETMESCLLGYWAEIGQNDDGLKYFIEKMDQEFYLSSGIFQNGGLEFLVKDKIRLQIIRRRNKIFIKNFQLKYKDVSELILLDNNRMTLKNGDTVTEFSKLD